MGLAPYAAQAVLRNRRRTISSILGVLLAVIFVSGTFIAIDSSARATLDAALAGISGDFSFSVNVANPASFNYTTLRDAISSTVGVVDTSLYRYIQVSQWVNPASPANVWYGTSTFAVDTDHLPSLIRDVARPGTLDIPRGSVAMTKEFASALGVGVGDRVTAGYQYNATNLVTTNLTVAAIIEPPSYPAYNGGYPGPPPYYAFGLTLIHLRDADWFLGQLNETFGYGYPINGEVWIDRTSYVNPYDVDGTTRNLERIQRRIQVILGADAYSIQDNILSRIKDVQDRIAGQRLQYLLFSLPVVFLGVYLGAVGVDLSHAERRRELAVVKTRGARRGQLITLLLLEAIVGGLIAAAVGLAIGVVLSRFLLGVVAPTTGAPPQYAAFFVSTDTVLGVGFLSVVLMFVVAYRSAKRTASLPIIETLRYYAPGETKIHYSPKWDIALVTIGALDYIGVWLSQGRLGGSLYFFLFIGILPILLIPFVPLMLIVGITRLLTRSTGKVYDWFSHAAKPLVGDLYYFVRRNLTRNPRRSSNVAIIIALGLAFGTFTLSVLATTDAHTVREIHAQVGADMAVSPLKAASDLTANLTAVPGVAGVSKVLQFSYVTPGYCCAGLWGVDPDSYYAVAQPESWYFADGNPQRGHDALATPGQVLISQSYYAQAYVEVGDRMTLTANVFDQNGTFLTRIDVNVTIAGVVGSLPGLGFGYGPSIYAGLATMAPFLSVSQSPAYRPDPTYLVDLAAGADWRTVKAAVIGDSNVYSVTVAAEQIEARTSNPFARALYQFVSTEIIFIGVILTAGVGLILYAASLERDVEFAAMIARGASGWKTAKLLVGEAFVIMLVGLVIGVSVGAGAAYFAIQFFAVGFTTPITPYFFVFPVEALLLAILGPAAMLLAAVIVSLRTAHLNVAQVLKLRGG
ncbi:MAG TPA: FtsX-like permease family protein [Thermoplasmata archaeon]|nr:FtsX-like permease family protein [Thermoplasmata archaeon]